MNGPTKRPTTAATAAKIAVTHGPGVEVSSSEVLWWSRPGGSGGRFGEAARGQSHEDYRLHGPAVACPPEVERQVDVAVGR